MGGDRALAAEALRAAATRSAELFELFAAEELLDEAARLDDSAAIRLDRGRLRLARLDLEAAGADAARAIELGAGVGGFELAGWVAYYARDYDTALRYADEGVERCGDDLGIRASCLALSGRIRHTRGELADAAVRLEEGVKVAPAAIRGVVQVWHAQLLAHRGDIDAAMETARRGLLDPHLAHPFAAGHGRFTLVHALGLSGRWAEALDAVDDLDHMINRLGDKRFPPVAANMRGWLLRGAGQLDAATELHQAAADMAPGPTFLEAHYAALLDLVEVRLAGVDLDGAAAALAECSGIVGWTGAMYWRHTNRYRLLADRIASGSGDHQSASEDARSVATAAAARGDRRYHCRAQLVATGAEARSGREPDWAELETVIERFAPISGPDGWRDIAELARATGSEALWRRAENEAAAIVRAAARRPGIDAGAVERSLRHQLDGYRR